MKKLRVVIFFLLSTLMAACGFYNPNLRNSPMLTKAGEVQANAQLGRGVEAQAAVAVTNHIGIISNFMYQRNGSLDNDFENRKFFEGGIGYFKNSGIHIFEAFAGYGHGDVELLNHSNHSNGERYSQTGKFNRFFIQPAIGYRSKVYNVTFAPRLSYVRISDYTSTSASHQHSAQGLYFEPACVNRIQLHHNVYLTFQTGIAIPIDRGANEVPILQMGGGVGFRMNALKQ